MQSMFYYCIKLTSLDVSGFDTSKVTNMYQMFRGCSSLTSLTLPESFDTSSVTDMSWMFGGCSSLTSLTLPESFDTSSVTDMSYMFYNCSGLTSLDVSGFNTSSVTYMQSMFMSCYALTTIYVSDLWSTEKVTSSSQMFYTCTALIGGAGTTFDSSHVDKTYAHVDGGTDNPGYFTYKAAPTSGGGGSQRPRIAERYVRGRR